MALSVPCATRAQLRHKARLFFTNVWIFLVFTVWTLLFLPWAFGIIFWKSVRPLPRGPQLMRRAIHIYGNIMWKLLRPAIPLHWQNMATIEKHKPCILVANHQSFLDLFLFGSQKTPEFVFVSKSWPYKTLFFFAPMMRYAEYIDIETCSQEEIEQRCKALLANNVSIVLFPEGQRTRTGELGRFHVGAFQLACTFQVPIVPMLIENSGKVFPVGAKYFTAQTIELAILQPLFPKDFISKTLPHRAMMRAARMQYTQHFNETNGGL